MCLSEALYLIWTGRRRYDLKMHWKWRNGRFWIYLLPVETRNLCLHEASSVTSLNDKLFFYLIYYDFWNKIYFRAGFYGSDCDKRCPQLCNSGHCNRLHGYCECGVGLTGPTCNLPCPPNSWGPNCEYTCQCQQEHSTGCNPKVSPNPILSYLLSYLISSHISYLISSHLILFNTNNQLFSVFGEL